LKLDLAFNIIFYFVSYVKHNSRNIVLCIILFFYTMMIFDGHLAAFFTIVNNLNHVYSISAAKKSTPIPSKRFFSRAKYLLTNTKLKAQLDSFYSLQDLSISFDRVSINFVSTQPDIKLNKFVPYLPRDPPHS
jgi:hypothetical protein